MRGVCEAICPRVSHQSGEPPCALTGGSGNFGRAGQKSEHRHGPAHTVEHVAGLRSRVKRHVESRQLIVVAEADQEVKR